ncbi:MAG: S-layer protein, partial [Akkermansiaceae bacterium]
MEGATAQPQGDGAEDRPLSFVSDVLPILAKSGCSSSGCHANPEGQNGFKLSIFSYDPQADYAAIVKEGRGRRVSQGVPERSLLLLKPTLQLPHEGGERLTSDSRAYQTLKRWIEEGMVYRHPHEPGLDR